MGLPTLDKTVFTELQAIMEDSMAEFIHTYMDNSPKLLQQMQTAIDAADAEGLFHAAHQLKGGSGSLGAAKLAELSLRIEEIGKSGSVAGTNSLMQQLQTEYAQLSEQLKAYL